MDCRVTEESLDRLPEFSRIPIRFEVRSVFDVEGDDPSSALLVERPLAKPWVKDYDSYKEERPTRWRERWDISNWGLLAARLGEQWVGGCALAYRTDGVDKLEGRDDLVALWDIRVHPDFRRKGIGRELFRAAIQWARDRQCRELKIETQNINVPACRFYRKQGSRLCSINRTAYDDFPDEIELMWSLDI
jgi:ribosomal protein S18 acetylase RimI-like enzyme